MGVGPRREGVGPPSGLVPTWVWSAHRAGGELVRGKDREGAVRPPLCCYTTQYLLFARQAKTLSTSLKNFETKRNPVCHELEPLVRRIVMSSVTCSLCNSSPTTSFILCENREYSVGSMQFKGRQIHMQRRFTTPHTCVTQIAQPY